MDVFELPMEVDIPIPTVAYLYASYIYRIYLLNANNIIIYVRLLRYICSRARGGLPFFSHSHVTDRLLPAKAAQCIGTSYTHNPGYHPLPPPPGRRSISAQFLCWPQIAAATITPASTNNYTSTGRPTT